MSYQLPLNIQITITEPNTGSNEWYTPAIWLARAKECLGEIDLDPCSCDRAQEIVKATYYYTLAQDGLCQPWHDRVWLNPPYDHPAPWTDRLIDEYRNQSVSAALCLVNASIAALWFQRLARSCVRRLDISPRINFWSSVNSGSGNRYDQVLFYFGKDPMKFEQVFAPHGILYGFPLRPLPNSFQTEARKQKEVQS